MAHTSKHLFEKIVDPENIEAAIRRAARGKRHKRVVRLALLNIDETVERVRKMLVDETYAPPRIRQAHEINDGFRLKKRIIVHPSFDELIVDHSVLQVLKGVFVRRFYHWSCGSIPGRGQESMIQYVYKKLLEKPKNCKYYVKLDVSKCFDSINPEVLKTLLKKYIRDNKLLRLLDRIIDANTLRLADGSTKKVGAPIGLYTSPWFANIVLTEIDKILKDKCGIYLEVRYIDDIFVSHGNRRELVKALEVATKRLAELGLKWKTKPIIRKWADGNIGKVRFCGVHLMRRRVQLHDSVYIRARRTANRILRKKKAKKRVTWYDAAKIISYGGRFKAFYSYRAFTRDVLGRAGIKYADMRRKISDHDKILQIKGLINE